VSSVVPSPVAPKSLAESVSPSFACSVRATAPEPTAVNVLAASMSTSMALRSAAWRIWPVLKVKRARSVLG
jgi:hypothetical protein